MNAREALEIYRDRDEVEKVFLSFIALIIRNEIYKLSKPLYLKNKKEYTVPKALWEYETLGVTRLSDNRYHVKYKRTSKQAENYINRIKHQRERLYCF